MADPQFAKLKNQVYHLFESMQGFRRELAAARHPEAKVDRFETMAEQLDAIVKGTEEATHTILQSIEGISELINQRRDELSAQEDGAWMKQIDELVNQVFVSCAFQDITGQRITKVVTSMGYIEGRINAMVELWGREGLSSEPVPSSDDEEMPSGEKLHGPALEGEGTSQEDIDKLFE